MKILTDSEIIHSWQVNAEAWISAIENEEIESRRLITNQAIFNAILAHHPKKLLDIGCGEGWLARLLAEEDIDVLGIDAIPALIDFAKKLGKAKFDLCLYENLSKYPFREKFDCIVCNFSLIGKEATEKVINTSANLLKNNGRFIIQTLHPIIACADSDYVEGRRPGSWSGFNESFSQPAPRYFRTIEAWFKLLSESGFKKINISEPIHPKIKKPASIIFECFI